MEISSRRKPDSHPGVYCFLNLFNGKRYVGSTSKSVRKRRLLHLWHLRHGSHVNKRLQTDWDKYGEKAFEFVVLELCDSVDRFAREQHWMDLYQSAATGYNCAPLAATTKGVRWSDESKERHSKLRKELCQDSQVRRGLLRASKLGAAAKAEVSRGVARTPEELANISAGVKVAMWRTDVRANVKAGQVRRVANPNLKKNISDGTRLAMQRPEVKAKMAAAVARRKAAREKAR